MESSYSRRRTWWIRCCTWWSDDRSNWLEKLTNRSPADGRGKKNSDEKRGTFPYWCLLRTTTIERKICLTIVLYRSISTLAQRSQTVRDEDAMLRRRRRPSELIILHFALNVEVKGDDAIDVFTENIRLMEIFFEDDVDFCSIITFSNEELRQSNRK